MKITGYERGKKVRQKGKLLALGEVAMIASPSQYKAIAKFLNAFAEAIENKHIDSNDHWHAQDMIANWEEQFTDIILCATDQENR